MPSTKNPFLKFRDAETNKMIGINIHNITAFKEVQEDGKPHVLVLTGTDTHGHKIATTFKEFQSVLRDWFGRNV